jgi:hypothetical protein
MKRGLLACITCCMVHPAFAADFTYTYTGQPYTVFYNFTVPCTLGVCENYSGTEAVWDRFPPQSRLGATCTRPTSQRW